MFFKQRVQPWIHPVRQLRELPSPFGNEMCPRHSFVRLGAAPHNAKFHGFARRPSLNDIPVVQVEFSERSFRNGNRLVVHCYLRRHRGATTGFGELANTIIR